MFISFSVFFFPLPSFDLFHAPRPSNSAKELHSTKNKKTVFVSSISKTKHRWQSKNAVVKIKKFCCCCCCCCWSQSPSTRWEQEKINIVHEECFNGFLIKCASTLAIHWAQSTAPASVGYDGKMHQKNIVSAKSCSAGSFISIVLGRPIVVRGKRRDRHIKWKCDNERLGVKQWTEDDD